MLVTEEDIKLVQSHIYKHLEKTDSPRARDILDRWEHFRPLFVKVLPKIEPVALPPEEEPAAAPPLAESKAAVAA